MNYCHGTNDDCRRLRGEPAQPATVDLFLPNPGFTLSQCDPAAINFDFNNENRGDNLVAKTDYVLNTQHVLSARFIYANTNQTEEDTIPLRPEWLSTTSPITQVFGVSLASNPTSAWSNEVRFSYNSFNEAIFPVDHNVKPHSYGLNTGVTDPRLFGFPRINPGHGVQLNGRQFEMAAVYDSQQDLSASPIRRPTHEAATRSASAAVFRYGDVNYYRASYGRGRIEFRHSDEFHRRRCAALAFPLRRSGARCQPEILGIFRPG